MPVASTVFVGGGTPTLVPPDDLTRVIGLVPTEPGAEVTVECNPDDLDVAHAERFRAGGVNRLSIGVQSMSPHVLATLGRTHDPANVERAVAAARTAGFVDLNLDIIYGAAGETVDDWQRTVEATIALGPDHVSAYGLTVEPGTALADDRSRYPDDDDQADKYDLADDLLAAAGYENYEVSNWAHPGHESRHNHLYWDQADYRGFGCAAHSHRQGRRWWNVRTPDRYIDLVERGESVEASAEELDGDTRRVEGLQLSLRTRRGVPAAAFDASDRELMDDLLDEHPDDAERLVLNRAGRLLANEVSTRLR